ncbi:MAG: DUF4335 domain-containing protein [Cyanobacteria bacterium Co-bin8]|nr:DUF4335 domain-containing protein [Cyanobacteria bacterium Co-bin8]
MTPISELTSLRYTAPTCTLEVMGELSPLSQVAEQPILKRLRFDLQIQDASGNPVIAARGMRSHLLDLSTLVQTYVQNYLNGPAESALRPAAVEGISLQPYSPSRHSLDLGNLAVHSGPRQVRLSTLQLADLADVLAQLEEAVDVLPTEVAPAEARSRRRSPSRRLAWGGTAAAALLVVVGASAVLPGILQRNSVSQLETTASAPAGSADSMAPEPGAESFSMPQTGLPEATEVPTAPGELNRAVPPAPSGAVGPPPVVLNGDAVPSQSPTAPSQSPAAPPTAKVPGEQQALPQPEAAPVPSEPGPEANRALEPAPPSVLSAPPQLPAQPPDASADSAVGSLSSQAAEAPPPAARSLEALQFTLQEQWVPPANLADSLVYVLVIDEAGNLQSVIPQGRLARENRDRIPLPPLGSPVLAPQASPQQLRLTLFPAGSVTLAPLAE